jgi:hypothetical protein
VGRRANCTKTSSCSERFCAKQRKEENRLTFISLCDIINTERKMKGGDNMTKKDWKLVLYGIGFLALDILILVIFYFGYIGLWLILG